MVQRSLLVDWLNSIEWLRPTSITQAAQTLIDDHLGKIRAVIEKLMAERGINAVEAHGFAQTAGHGSPTEIALLDDMFSKVKFRGSQVRESLILTITAAYCWDHDSELCLSPNPWEPLVELYGMGYTTSGEDDPDGNGLVLLVGFKSGISSYRVM